MRKFVEIKRELDLKKFLFSRNGTLHFPIDDNKMILVRHFDQDIPPELVPVYHDVIKELNQFVQKQKALNTLIVVQQPLEVGLDFIARTHHVYYVSVDDYFDDDTSYEIPSQFQLLKDVFIALQKNEMTKQDKFLFGILEKSFILPTSKTYFNNSMEKFINVDPKMDINDLNEWNSMKNN